MIIRVPSWGREWRRRACLVSRTTAVVRQIGRRCRCCCCCCCCAPIQVDDSRRPTTCWLRPSPTSQQGLSRSKLDKMTLKLSASASAATLAAVAEVFEPKSRFVGRWLVICARVSQYLRRRRMATKPFRQRTRTHKTGRGMHSLGSPFYKNYPVREVRIPRGMGNASLHLEAKRETGWFETKLTVWCSATRILLRSARRSVANWREGASACLPAAADPTPVRQVCKPAQRVDVTPILMFPFLLLLRRRWRRPTVRATIASRLLRACNKWNSQSCRTHTCRAERASQVRDSDGRRMRRIVRLEIRLVLVVTRQHSSFLCLSRFIFHNKRNLHHHSSYEYFTTRWWPIFLI